MASLLPTGVKSCSGEERSEFGPVSLVVALLAAIVGVVGAWFYLKDAKTGKTHKAAFRPPEWALKKAASFLRKEGVNDPAREIDLACAIAGLKEEEVGKLRGDPDEITGMPADAEEGIALCEAMGLKVRNISGYEARWKSLRRLSKAEAKSNGLDVSKMDDVKPEAKESTREPAFFASIREEAKETRDLLKGLLRVITAAAAAKPSKARA